MGKGVPVAFSAIVAGAVAAAAQDDDRAGPTRDEEHERIEEIVVVGTRRQERSSAQSPVPVDVIGARQLRSQGDGDMLDVLAAQVPSYNVGREPISDAATLLRPANLRGMPADSTLILVNGKRRHRGGVIGEFVAGINKGAQAVDIAPLAGIAMKQVEVLRDGASAQYGSDAIAGVMNFVLQDDPDARRFDIQYGQTFVGDGDQITAAGVFGTRLGGDGFLTFALELKDSAPTSRGSQDPQASHLVANGYTDVANPVVIWGAPDVENEFSLLANAAVEAGVGELYGFGNWSGRDVDGSFFYRNPNTRTGVFADGMGSLLVADVTPNDAAACERVAVADGLADRSALARVMADPNCFVYSEWFPGGFTPRFGGEIGDSALTAGWRGVRPGGLRYDFSVSAGRNEAVYRIRNTVNASYGPNTPTAFDLGAQIQFERLLNADFALPVDVGAYSDLNVAFGAQHHKEVFEMVAGDTESWAPGGFEDQGFSVGSNGFQGFSADVAGRFGRDSYAGWLDLEVDATSRWLVSGALRYENFSDAGDTLKGKMASRLALSDNVALRAAGSTGFRAPSIGQSSLRRAATVFRDGRLQESLTLPPTDPVAMLKGGRQLDPEESVNFSVGAALALGPVNVTLDWFRITVDGRIVLTEQSLSAENRAELLTANVVGAETVTAVAFFVNDIDTETTGLDLVADTALDLADGRLEATLAWNVTDTQILERGATLSDRGVRELEDGLPESRGTLTLDYARGSWTALLRWRYYGELYEHLFNCESCWIETGAMVAVDAELSWAASDHLTATLGFKNVGDRQPDRHRFAGVAGYLGADYPLNHPAGFNGGSYFLRLSNTP
ncbi:MAG: TonB-dependent receptor [Gammaproteobacteria bacterium]|nr:TonB-dependent receptor [Gammaproteobacteria bacterium]